MTTIRKTTATRERDTEDWTCLFVDQRGRRKEKNAVAIADERGKEEKTEETRKDSDQV